MTKSLSLRYRLFSLVLGDIFLSLIALYAALFLRFGYREAYRHYMFDNWVVPLLLMAVVIFCSYLAECYSLDRNIRKLVLVRNTLIASALSFVALSSLYYLDPEVMIGRGLLVLMLTVFALTQIGWHFIFFFNHSSPRFAQRVIIVGIGANASAITAAVAASHGLYTLIGYVCCGAEVTENGIGPQDILGSSEELRDLALRHNADLVVVALTERRGVFPLRDALSCKLNGVEVVDAPTFYESVCGKLMLERITPSWFIFSSGFRRPFHVLVAKRFIDMVLSLVGMLLTLPLFPFIALAIKLDSPGPLFFSQQRVGNQERLFKLYKFRTMRQDAEAKSGAVWATENDPRVTRFGRFMRKTRIDEIPQLFNVLLGSMSFVGPRPERPEFVEKLKEIIPYYSRRHFLKPGVTGWAQVRYPYGASVDDAVEKLRYDLYYVKNLSPILDSVIFFETIKVVLFGRGR